MFKLFRKKVPRRNYLRSGDVIAKWFPADHAYYCFFSGDAQYVQDKRYAFCYISRWGICMHKYHKKQRCSARDAVDFAIIVQWVRQELGIENTITLTA
jgi:hypothetical protein